MSKKSSSSNKRPIRLAIVIDDLAGGGAARVAAILGNRWAEKGWAIYMLTSDDGANPPLYTIHENIQHLPLSAYSNSRNAFHSIWLNMKRIRTLRRAIGNCAPDVVISFLDRNNVLTLLATYGMGVPVIVSERIDPHMEKIGRVWETLRSLTYLRASCLVVQTERAGMFFSSQVQKNMRIIPNPVIIPAQVLHERNSVNKKVILAMGRLTEQKGFDLLIDAFAQVAQRHSKWHLVIYGEGLERWALEKLIEKRGLSSRVQLPGITIKPFEEMARAELFVLSSRYEGFPNVLCEAMACGLAVISFDCPSGPREIIRDGVDGVLVLPGDVNALATALDDLMANPEKREQMSIRAPEVLERFSLKKIMEMWEQLIEEVLHAYKK